MDPFAKGWLVAGLLAVMTIAEYFAAVHLDDQTIRFVGLSVTALAKAWLITVYFMHISRAWRTSGGH